ncbi:26S proteasome non-ATPase regulatory subunit 4 homolog [Zea mays]|uniref:26S proteasome non-ATPase regulatory subunit 4 homolog n=1 Tax=Zea mays TaxID=4577 RepID=UPI00165296EF|nr:26S proteasome non-ATPase regulatory subunit 4 homolog [Zea mays]
MRVFLLLLARAMGSKASFCVTFLLLLLIVAAAWGPAAQADDAGIAVSYISEKQMQDKVIGFLHDACSQSFSFEQKDDDDLLQQALAMSMEGGASGSVAVTDSAMAEAGAVDPDLVLALQMSVQDANMSSDTDMSKVFEDRTFVSSILNSEEKKEDKSDKTEDEKNCFKLE